MPARHRAHGRVTLAAVRAPALFAVALAVVFDHAGFLAWTLNASRIWTFVLFFGLILFALRRDSLSEPHRFLAYLTLSTAFGVVVASSTQFVEGFLVGTLPLASFIIAPALGAVALELQTAFGMLLRSPQLGKVTTSAVLVPLVMATAIHFRPSFEHELLNALPATMRENLQSTRMSGAWFSLSTHSDYRD